MSIFSYISSGGPIMYVLLLMSMIGVSIIIWKVFYFNVEKNHIESNAVSILKKIGESTSEISDESAILELVKDQVYSIGHRLERGLTTVKIIATISPLLGLLGTVMGVLSAFQSIAEHGLKDPSIFAGGISMALITTIGGILVAIPHLISYNYLTGWLNSYEIRLEEALLRNYVKGPLK
ncbi:MAG: MotA/TolQ/ExbB proton channel family protein [Deltaproteobacteria bacterium]|nr:MAG: MotA/TolQ/ExbB proton channel family protein [Deltaproteobacteria bacterium]